MAYQPYIKKSDTELVELPLNASLLDGKSPSYYLDYNNLINIPSSSKVEDYYWANIKISSSSSTTTSPTFKNINSINDSDYHSISTGANDSSFFQSRKFRGDGNADTYYHAVDFGYSGHNQVDFYEYGGIYTFYQNTTADASSKVELLKITPSTLTYKGIGVAMENESANSLDLSIDNSTYVITATLKNKSGKSLSTKTIDLPLESVVVNGSYDSTNKKVILTLQNGSKIDFSVADLVSGLQSEITSSNKLDYSLIANTPTIPTKTSQLTNDSGFLTSHQNLDNYVTLDSSQTITGTKKFTSIAMDTINSLTLGNAMIRQNTSSGDIILGSANRKTTIWGNTTRPIYSANGGGNNNYLALLSDLDSKLDKVTTKDTYQLYGKNANGEQQMLDYSLGTVGWSIVQRDVNGCINVAYPTDTYHATNKQYVDERSGVTGVKGNSETSYRTGNVNITKSNIGLSKVRNVSAYSKSETDNLLGQKMNTSNFNTPVIVSNGTTSIQLPSKGIYMFLYYSFNSKNTHIVFVTYNGVVQNVQYVSYGYTLVCSTSGVVKDSASAQMNARIFKISDYGWGD